MINVSVQAAVVQLQQQALQSHDVYELDRLDRAIDELVRNPDKSTPPAFQRRSAMANANKILQYRKRTCPVTSLDEQTPDCAPSSSDLVQTDGAPDELDIRLWLETTPSLTAMQRSLLRAFADGHDARSIAKWSRTPVARVREQISRARAAGWAAYQREMQIA